MYYIKLLNGKYKDYSVHKISILKLSYQLPKVYLSNYFLPVFQIPFHTTIQKWSRLNPHLLYSSKNLSKHSFTYVQKMWGILVPIVSVCEKLEELNTFLLRIVCDPTARDKITPLWQTPQMCKRIQTIDTKPLHHQQVAKFCRILAKCRR